VRVSPQVPSSSNAKGADPSEREAFKKVIMALPGRPEAMKMGPSPR
jgi:hypothetical protein